MALQLDDIEKIAHLAQLNLSEDDKNLYFTQISNILQLIAEMDKENTQTITPLAHPLELAQRLREDRVTEADLHEKYQAVAPHVEADLYLVPKVIAED